MTDWFSLKHVTKPFERENKMCCNWQFILFCLSVWYTCMLHLLNVHYKCVTSKYESIMDQVCYESSKSPRFEVCTEMNIETVALWDMTPLCRLIDTYQHFFFLLWNGGSRFLQNIGNHLHVSPPEDCSVIVNKDYSLVECGNLWLLRWILDYMHRNAGSHLHAGLHSITSQKTVMWES